MFYAYPVESLYESLKETIERSGSILDHDSIIEEKEYATIVPNRNHNTSPDPDGVLKWW